MKISVDKDFSLHMEKVRNTAEYRMEALKLEITESLCKAMKERDISKADLANRMGTSRSYITKLLNGNVNFTLETLVRVSDAIGVKLQPLRFEKVMSSEAASSSGRLREQVRK